MTSDKSIRQREHLCGRALHRESLRQFTPGIDWLSDPDTVPDRAFLDEGEVTDRSFFLFSEWMTDEFSVRARDGHSRLALKENFEKYDLPGPSRVAVREGFRFDIHRRYRPGFTAIADIFSAVPELATRLGIPSHCWGEVGLRSRPLADELSKHGTFVQALIRHYLSKDMFDPTQGMDPSLLTIDTHTGGMTTVTGIEVIVACAKDVLDFMGIDSSGHCVALQVKSVVGSDQKTIFDDVWKVYADVSEARIFPKLQAVQPAQESSPDLELKRRLLSIAQMTHGNPYESM